MYLTGFADEAADSLAGQIQATQELAWSRIESRNIDKCQIHDLPEADFDRVCGRLSDAGISINCFGSGLANWARKINEDFSVTTQQIDRAIPRMQRLGTQLIRVMSFAPAEGSSPADGQELERFRRLSQMKKRFDDAGILMVHENCMTWGGLSWQHTLRMIDAVPGLKLVYDTGNPIETPDWSKPEPRPQQSSWEFYKQVREHIAYIHIKDGVWDPDKKHLRFTYPGEGQAEVRRILADLKATGYDGGISIEPHLAVVAHDPSITSSDEIRYANYVEYGKRTMQILRELGWQAA